MLLGYMRFSLSKPELIFNLLPDFLRLFLSLNPVLPPHIVLFAFLNSWENRDYDCNHKVDTDVEPDKSYHWVRDLRKNIVVDILCEKEEVVVERQVC